MIIGSVVAILIDNPFLVPVFAFAFAMIPFIYAKRTVNFYDNHIKEELETALSIITTSYVRTDDIVTAVKENVQYLKPPVKDIFASSFVLSSRNTKSASPQKMTRFLRQVMLPIRYIPKSTIPVVPSKQTNLQVRSFVQLPSRRKRNELF